MAEHDIGPSQEALLAGAAAEAAHLADVSEQLLSRIRMSKIERTYFIVITMLIALIGVGLLYLGIANRQNTAATRTNTHLIIDCTSPSAGVDSCYQRSQRQTARAVTAIVQAQLASAWCSSHSKSFSEAQKCVALLIKPSSG